VDHVSDPGHGLPHYSVQTLNPTWDTSQPSKLVTIPSFKLVDQNGAEIDERIFDGKITVVGFMFTACQGFCPFVVEGMKSIERDFKTKAQFIALSVDPENDSVAQLKSYTKRHGLTSSNWHLLTGDKDTIYGLAKRTFASQAFKKPSKDPNFIHSEHLYVIGPDRRLRGVLNGTRIDVKRDARAVITELERTTTQM
jgi:protein SCO1/2